MSLATTGTRVRRTRTARPQASPLTRVALRPPGRMPPRVERALIPAATTRLHLSAAEGMAGSSGFLRGRGNVPYYVRPGGEVIADPHRMRIDCLSLGEHVERVFQSERLPVAAALSYGDLMTNEEYVAWSRAGGLFCRASEARRFYAGYVYHALGTDREGAPWAGRIRFARTGDACRILTPDGVDLTDRLETVFSGPPVSWDGRPLAPVETASKWVADLRHVLTLPVCPLRGGGFVLLGEAELMADPGLLAAAVRGEPVRVPLPAGDPGGLREDAIRRGYRLVVAQDEVTGPGRMAIDDAGAVIAYLPGLYPHSFLGLDATRGHWIHVLVDGVSTVSGCTLAEAGEVAARAGAAWAIALDQGADPQRLLRVRGEFRFRPSFTWRARVSAALVWLDRPAA